MVKSTKAQVTSVTGQQSKQCQFSSLLSSREAGYISLGRRTRRFWVAFIGFSFKHHNPAKHNR